MKRLLSLLTAFMLLALGGMAQTPTHGLVQIPVTCMRTAPSHAAEQSTQAVLGTPVRIISQTEDWYKVEMPDGYTGYMKANTIRPLSDSEHKQWLQAPRVVCKSRLTWLEDKEGQDGYAPYGAILVHSSTDTGKAGYVSVTTPAGKHLYVKESDVWTSMEDWIRSNSEGGPEEVIRLAYTMLGCPYLWGGTSSLAPDCSGFTQIAFTAAGLLIPRDTSMQIKYGEAVPSIKEARRGDLIFYGNNGRVNHVAIYLGEGKIIHSSGHVRICRMYPDIPGEEDLFTLRPMAIRRYTGAAELPGISRQEANPWYFPSTDNSL